MKKLLRSTVIAAASVASIFASSAGKQDGTRHKKTRDSSHPKPSTPPPSGGKPPLSLGISEVQKQAELEVTPEVAFTESPAPQQQVSITPTVEAVERYPWKRDIVTTTFWIGEKAGKNNPVPNRASSWDVNWAENYGGTDSPDRDDRKDYRPAAFVPRQNPFYVALPYNDMQMDGLKPEAKKLIPWFSEEYSGKHQSVCKGRWVAIRFKDRVAYAQWEDCGPFRTDHGDYVFGNERPKKNLNKGAGLDVSPGVRDFLGMKDSDVTDWKFVDFDEVPEGPWAKWGDNNTFVINKRIHERDLAALEKRNRKSE